MKYLQPPLFAGLFFLFTGCMDSNPPIKEYNFGTQKTNLQKIVLKVIASNPHLAIDTTPITVLVRRHPDVSGDTSTMFIKLTDFHNQKDSMEVVEWENRQVHLLVKIGDTVTRYSFMYAGDAIEWATSSNTTIFLERAEDKEGHSVIRGEDKHGEFNTQRAKDFIALFDREVVDYIRKEIIAEHI
ncbi:hypothetical protein [Pinibacter soli]|uniref:Uncharacterized protein n=1 Tax=Pinibacter soli TaxID=3044211 RepID=A0ABT6REM5_9BACT|nr:hypothetical protein [Pinibacter soli]MDI3320997.1 hypothetical protein [Pinibacter soli]